MGIISVLGDPFILTKCETLDFQPWKDSYRKDRLCGPRLEVPLHGIIYYNICAGVYVMAFPMWLSISPTPR
jgi:hypothetical protein